MEIMLSSIASKIYLTALAFSVLLFSNYTGNNAEFTDLNAKLVGDNIVFNTFLKNSFENDFDEIFKSGKNINVWFEFRVLKDNKIIHFEKFYHQVKWNPAKKVYSLDLQEQNFKCTVKNNKELLYLISKIECPFYKANYKGDVTVEFKSYLPKVYLETINKEVDLMLLWKMNKPSIRKDIKL